MARSSRTVLERLAVASALAGALVLAGCSSDGTDRNTPTASSTAVTDVATAPHTDTASPTSPAPASSGTAAGPGRNADLATATFELSWEQAVEIANGRFAGQLTEVGLDWEANQWAYVVELVSDTQEYDVKISATDGAVLSESMDTLDTDDDSRDEIFDPTSVIDMQQATSAALGEVEGQITNWKLEGSSRGTFFEFEILPGDGRDDVDVRVDATSGALVEAR